MGNIEILSGGVSLALRRNLAHASAQSVLDCTDLEKERKALTRWERKSASALMVCSCLFYEACVASCRSSQARSFAVHRVASDATNSNMLKGCKLQVCELDSTYIFEGEGLPPFAENYESDPALYVHHTRIWTDVQRVLDATGRGCEHLTRKQVVGAGCDAWGSEATAALSRWGGGER